jgi:hypothetical protein
MTLAHDFRYAIRVLATRPDATVVRRRSEPAGRRRGSPVSLGGLERALARTPAGEPLRLAVVISKDRVWPESTQLEQHYREFLVKL